MCGFGVQASWVWGLGVITGLGLVGLSWLCRFFFDAGGHTAAFFERGLRGHRSRGNMHMSSKQVFKRVFIPAEKSGMYVGLELPGISYKP